MAGRQIHVLYAVVATVAGAALGAWIAGSRIESPADVAARTATPAPSPILVPVERRALSSDVVTRGTVRFGLPQPVSIAPSTLKPSAGLVATLPLRNTQFAAGDVLLTASGRPVFVLEGEVPTYRDLVPGISGEDVRQLEQGLARLGFDPGAVDGVFDPATSAAVSQWYKARGWEPFGPTREQLAAIRGLERDWGDAVKARLAAAAAAASVVTAVESARATAEQNNRAAALERAAREDERRRLIQKAGSGAPLAVESERAKAEYANTAAAADLAAQIADRAMIVLDPRQPETARMAADAKLDLARAAKRKTRLEGELAIQAAERDATLAAERLRLAEAAVRSARLDGEKSVRAALDAQKLAEFDLKIATERADQLAADLDLARRRLGVQVPADELVFIRSLPVRVEEVTASVGGAVAGHVMSVTDNQLRSTRHCRLDAAPLVRPGMAVAIDEQALGIKATGIVANGRQHPGHARRRRVPHLLRGSRRQEPGPARGVSVRLTIPSNPPRARSPRSRSAPFRSPPTGRRGSRSNVNGALEYVAVKPGLSADGYVEVTPVDGALPPGQMVVVGYKNPEAGNPR